MLDLYRPECERCHWDSPGRAVADGPDFGMTTVLDGRDSHLEEEEPEDWDFSSNRIMFSVAALRVEERDAMSVRVSERDDSMLRLALGDTVDSLTASESEQSTSCWDTCFQT